MFEPFSLKRKTKGGKPTSGAAPPPPPVSALPTGTIAEAAATTCAMEEEEPDEPDEWAATSDASLPSAAALLAGFRATVLEGVRFAEHGDLDAAQASFRRACLQQPDAVRGTPEEAQLLEMFAQVFAEQSQYFSAIQECERAIAVAPGFGAAWLTLGRAQLNFGELELARASLATALGLLASAASLKSCQADMHRLDADLIPRHKAMLRARELQLQEAAKPKPTQTPTPTPAAPTPSDSIGQQQEATSMNTSS